VTATCESNNFAISDGDIAIFFAPKRALDTCLERPMPHVLSRSLVSHCTCLSVPNSPYSSQLIHGSHRLEVQFPFVFRAHPTRQGFGLRFISTSPISRSTPAQKAECPSFLSLSSPAISPRSLSVRLPTPLVTLLQKILPSNAKPGLHLPAPHQCSTGVGSGPIPSSFPVPLNTLLIGCSCRDTVFRNLSLR
jgi:hypothetical protein